MIYDKSSVLSYVQVKAVKESPFAVPVSHVETIYSPRAAEGKTKVSASSIFPHRTELSAPLPFLPHLQPSEHSLPTHSANSRYKPAYT